VSLNFAHVGRSRREPESQSAVYDIRRRTEGSVSVDSGILLADDHHQIVREGFRALLERAELNVIAEASNGREALQAATEFQPGIAILDISMPVLNGCDAYRELARVSPKTKVIILTVHTEEPFVLESLRAGAKGYVLKNRGASGLIEAIRVVSNGEVYLSPGIAKSVIQTFLGESVVDELSSRERQVVQLIAEGMATKEVAALLEISVKTAESHRNRIMQKLNIHDTAGVVRYAVRRGLTEA